VVIYKSRHTGNWKASAMWGSVWEAVWGQVWYTFLVYSKGRVYRWWPCDGIPLEESVTIVALVYLEGPD